MYQLNMKISNKFYLIFILVWYIGCNCIDLTDYGYKILSLKINNEEVLSEFNQPHTLTLWDNHRLYPGQKKVSLLKKKGYTTGFPLKYPDWYLNKENCTLVITDTLQNIFTGVYSITEIPHKPMRYLLKSDSIEILMERLEFTVEKPYLDVPLFDTTRNY